MFERNKVFFLILFLRGMDSTCQTLALRSSIIIGLITAVATILYFTPLPGKFFKKGNWKSKNQGRKKFDFKSVRRKRS